MGSFGLKSIGYVRITAKQMEAARRAITRKIRRRGKLWLKIFPHIPVTSKPTEVRMGKGKGSIAFWEAQVDAGQILLELSTSKELAQEALALIYAKSPIPLLFVEREEKSFQ